MEFTANNDRNGFVSQSEVKNFPQGLNEDIIRLISDQKKEPSFLRDWRLKAYRHWITMEEPHWQKPHHLSINYQDLSYLDELPVNSELTQVVGTRNEKLDALGVIFCSMAEAAQRYPDLLEEYLGSVVPYNDNFFSTLNSAVFSDGLFCLVPAGVSCPMDFLLTNRRTAANSRVFERTLIIGEKGSRLHCVEDDTDLLQNTSPLHAAVVEVVALEDAEIKYSTLQNWYSGDKAGRGGILNFATKRGRCKGANSKISWTQVDTGSAITWKYPSVILAGDRSVGEFYSVAVTNDCQQADTGTKMIHIGKYTKSTIISKGISAGYGQNSYRGLVSIHRNACHSLNYSQCDALLIGEQAVANSFPSIEIKNRTSQMTHEGSMAKIDENQLLYCQSRGLSAEEAVLMIANGFCRSVFSQLPKEFFAEAQKMLAGSLCGAIA